MISASEARSTGGAGRQKMIEGGREGWGRSSHKGWRAKLWGEGRPICPKRAHLFRLGRRGAAHYLHAGRSCTVAAREGGAGHQRWQAAQLVALCNHRSMTGGDQLMHEPQGASASRALHAHRQAAAAARGGSCQLRVGVAGVMWADAFAWPRRAAWQGTACRL